MRGKSTLVLVVCSLVLITAPARAGALEVRQEIARIAAEMFIAGQYDLHLTRQLITLIEEPPIPEAWNRLKPTFEDCRDWANG